MTSLLAMAANGEIEKTGAAKKLNIENFEQTTFAVYRIPLNLLYYNDQNGRTYTAYSKWLAENNNQRLLHSNKKYNEFFSKFVQDSNPAKMKATFESIKEKGQQEPGAVLADGRIIDGNRRFTALQKLKAETGIEPYFEAVILPFDIGKDVDAKKIKTLELDMQMAREERVDYDPIDRVFDAYDTVEVRNMMTASEYAKAVGKQRATSVNNDIAEAKLIIEFLDFINAPEGASYLAKDMRLDGPMHEILRFKNKYAGNNFYNDVQPVFAVLASLYADSDSTHNDADKTRIIRQVTDDIMRTNLKEEFVEKTQSSIDTIYDSFRAAPTAIRRENEVNGALTANDEVQHATSEILRINRQMIRRSKNEKGKEEVLNTLRDCNDGIQSVNEVSIGNLSANDYHEFQLLLEKITKRANDLKQVQIDV